jgi:hypothetical protein
MSRDKYKDSEIVGDEAYVAYSGVTRLNRACARGRDPHTEYSVTKKISNKIFYFGHQNGLISLYA